MITSVLTIKLKPQQPLFLIPIGDIHFHSRECDEDRLFALINWAVLQKKNGAMVRFIGLGDYLEMPSPSERAALIGAKGGYGLHETTLDKLDEMYEGLTTDFIKVMRPVKDDVIGLLSGHHYVNFAGIRDDLRGLNTDELICQKLGCLYLGTIAQIKFKFPQANESVDIWAHHGFGSARTKGAKLSKRLRVLEGFKANIVLMGHDNAKFTDESQQIVLRDDGTVRYEKVYLIGTGSFQKAYAIGRARGGYAEEMAFNPNGLGVTMVRFELLKHGGGYKIDYHVSV